MDPIEATVRHALEELGADYELLPCDPALAETVAFAEHYGVALGDSANAIIVAAKTEPRRYVCGVVLATTRLDVNGAVRRRLGVRKASFAHAEETAALTGMAIGGVTPLALPPEVPVWVDARVMQRPAVVIGGGSRSLKVRVAPGIFDRLPGAEVVEGLAIETT